MSLASPPDCFRRPEDKALKLHFPTAEPPDSSSFDEFFNKDFFGNSGEEDVKQESDEADDFFAVNAYGIANEHDTIYAEACQSERSPPQSWRKGVWCLNQSPGSQLKVEKTRKAKDIPTPDISPAHLIVNDNFALRSLRSITQPPYTKSPSPDRLQPYQCWSPGTQQRTQYEMKLSPSPMYSRSFVNDRNGYVDAWQHDFQNFNLQVNDDYLDSFSYANNHFLEQSACSPRRSRRALMATSPSTTGPFRAATMHHGTIDPRQEDKTLSAHELSSRLNANLNATNHNMFSSPPDSDDPSFRFINEELPGMSDWTTESMHSPNSSGNSQFSSNSSYESKGKGMYNTLPPQYWWSPPMTHAQTQPTQASRDNYPVLVQPKPRRATHHVLSQEDLHDHGLGINYPGSDEIGIAVPYHPPELQHSSILQIESGYQAARSVGINALSSYPALPPPIHQFSQGSPFATPRRKAQAPSRTPSPLPSLSHRPSRSSRQRSPSRRDASSHRRKSLHKSGPMRDGVPETPRHRSTSRPPRTPKTPKTPGDGFASIDFVNFTPKDANKLLSDVAPSGSSKTRARREQEAREKRKKLSEAALQAVRCAGGDVEALERAILT